MSGLNEALMRIDQISRRIDQMLPGTASLTSDFSAQLAAAQSAPQSQPAESPTLYAPPVSPAGAAVPGSLESQGTALSEAPADIKEKIMAASDRYKVDPSLIAAVVKAESNFSPTAKSGAGAMGLMQLMPATARSLGVTDPYDVRQNIEGGTRYLKQLLGRFDGNIKLALAGYNAGPGAVERYGGIPPYKETTNYVRKVLNYLQPAAGQAGTISRSPGLASIGSGGTGAKIVSESKKYLGIPYVWGGNTPTQGFDCSGFTKWVYAKNGIELPRVSKDQAYAGTKVSRAELRPGDLMFFARNGQETRSAIHHVGIYIGDGQMINAPSRGKTVRIESIETPYRQREFIWGRRLT